MNPITRGSTIHKDIDEYMTKVFDILESFDYPLLISEFETNAVSNTLAGWIIRFFFHDLSPMMCAILIWSLTLNLQIFPLYKNQVKH